jgi:hypothetical protein
MGKKTRKNIARKNPVIPDASNAKPVDNKSISKTNAKVPAATGKTSISAEDLSVRYQYVKDDLKTIALIALPMIFGLFILALFLKV